MEWLNKMRQHVFAPVPTWTKEPPTVAGWYWVRADDMPLVIVLVTGENVLWSTWSGRDGDSRLSELSACEWCGPIVSPEG